MVMQISILAIRLNSIPRDKIFVRGQKRFVQQSFWTEAENSLGRQICYRNPITYNQRAQQENLTMMTMQNRCRINSATMTQKQPRQRKGKGGKAKRTTKSFTVPIWWNLSLRNTLT